MTHALSLDLAATTRTEAVPAYVATARASCALMSDAQRVAFAHELISGIRDDSCRLSLRRLITLANQVALELGREAFLRECDA